MRRPIYLGGLVLAIILIGFSLVVKKEKSPIDTPETSVDENTQQGHANSTSRITSSQTETRRPGSIAQLGIEIQDRHLFKTTNYPPQTAEEKEQWKWWQAMRKTDPKFEWKMPIEFYGKVVDQLDEPVSGAEVVLNWTTVVGPDPAPKKTMYADPDGRFSIKGIQGNGITIIVQKQGYDRTRDCIQSFEYAAFYKDNFHVPDPSKPVVFHLHKLLGAEPMYQFEVDSKMARTGTELILDVARGKVGTTGDFAFSVRVGGTHGEVGPNYTVTLRALQGAGFVSTTDPFPFQPPEGGYETEVTASEISSEPGYDLTHKFQFYVRTRNGKYGIVWAEVSISRFGDDANFNSTVRYNPSGSRNLEFDQDKWINR